MSRSFRNLTYNLNETSKDVNNATASFESENPKIGDTLVFKSITNIAKVIKSMAMGIWNTIFVLSFKTLGLTGVNGAIIYGALGAILALTLLLLIWKLIRTGS